MKNDCGQLMDFKSKDMGAHDALIQWALGYISGAAIFGPRSVNPFRNTDIDEAKRWIDEYCVNISKKR